jgi:hypothetical protein
MISWSMSTLFYDIPQEFSREVRINAGEDAYGMK